MLIKVGQSTEVLTDNYMKKIIQLHCILVNILSDRDTGFRSSLW